MRPAGDFWLGSGAVGAEGGGRSRAPSEPSEHRVVQVGRDIDLEQQDLTSSSMYKKCTNIRMDFYSFALWMVCCEGDGTVLFFGLLSLSGCFPVH